MAITDYYYLRSISHCGGVGLHRDTIIQSGNLIYYEVIVYAASMKVTVSTSQLLMECIYGSCCWIWIWDMQHLILRNPRSRSVWCDYSCLDEQFTASTLNYGEIKRADMTDVCMKLPELDAIIICPCIKKSSIVTSTMWGIISTLSLNMLISTFFTLWILPVKKQPGKHDKDFVNPLWDMRLWISRNSSCSIYNGL